MDLAGIIQRGWTQHPNDNSRRDPGPPYAVSVQAHWHNTDDAGLTMECTCNRSLDLCSCRDDEPAVDTVGLADLNRLAAEHLATH